VVLALNITLSVFAAHTKVDLLLSHDAVRPGQTILAGVRLRMEDDWHTYWRNPGASGMATSIKWTLPKGMEAGDIQWPLPEKLPDEDLTTYIYHGEAVLVVPITIGATIPTGNVTIAAEVAWLECKEQCLPGDAKVSVPIEVSQEARASSNAPLIKGALEKIPESGEHSNPTARWEGPPKDETRQLILEWKSNTPSPEDDFYPNASDGFEVAGPTERLEAPAETVRLRKAVRTLNKVWPKEVSGLAVHINGKSSAGYEVSFKIEDSTPTSGATSPALPSGSSNLPQSLWVMLLYAFVGGLILNIMPCVLPVIALKILGFVSQSRDEPAKIRKLGMLYALGVLVSFLALAVMVIAVKAAGHKAGWGMQFGNPQFLVVLTVIVTLVALNLFGLFEISPGAQVMGAAGSLASKSGAGGAFFNGVLATVLATPCTAPFLGAALGFAFAQSSSVIVLVFSAVAAGLAFPYVLLSWNPRWLKWLPKPGVWMERFKVAMGFPMLATAVWLFSLAPIHYGGKSVWLGIFLVLVGMAAWVFGQFVQRGGSRIGLGWVAALVLLGGGYVFALENQMGWRSPEPPDEGVRSASGKGMIPWETWSPEAVATARAEQRPVLVDFTAQWCLTCQANKKIAIEVPDVVAKLKAINATALLGDYTRLPPAITDELNRFGRAGVPLVLVYPKNPAAPPIVLPEVLTPGTVLDALNRANQ
jgi:thiol:disulfide interchange protein DsbD